jgi:hypothetical protein
MDTNIEEFIDTHESVPQHMREMMNVFNGLLGLESWSFVDYYHTLKPDVLDEQWCNERERSHVNFCVHGLIVHIQIQMKHILFGNTFYERFKVTDTRPFIIFTICRITTI